MLDGLHPVWSGPSVVGATGGLFRFFALVVSLEFVDYDLTAI